MSLDNTKLLDFLEEIDRELSCKIVIVAVGGTAMTLANAKPSTIDIDFTIPGKDYDEFERARKIAVRLSGGCFSRRCSVCNRSA